MPHPERTPAGLPIFTSMREYITEQKSHRLDLNLDYTPAPYHPTPYTVPPNSFTLPIELIITDNEAVTVENSLAHLGIPVKLKRFVHWQIDLSDSPPPTTRAAIIASGELFNNNKEKIVELPAAPQATRYLLVRYRDDFEGQAKREALNGRFGLSEVASVHKGILWQITGERDTIELLMERIFSTHILFNPYSQECFKY